MKDVERMLKEMAGSRVSKAGARAPQRQREAAGRTTYRLASGVARARASRDFEIPPASERRSLQAGDRAKLIFVVSASRNTGERMWVKVTGRDRGAYVGRLDNTPAFPAEVGIRRGGEVRFTAEHVIDIIRA